MGLLKPLGRFRALWCGVVALALASCPAQSSSTPRNTAVRWPPVKAEMFSADMACLKEAGTRRALVRAAKSRFIQISRSVFLRYRDSPYRAPPALRIAILKHRDRLGRCFGVRLRPLPPPCAVSLEPLSELEIVPGANRTVQLSVQTTCAATPTLKLQRAPVGGTAAIVGSTLAYAASLSDAPAADVLVVQACAPSTRNTAAVCSPRRSIVFNRCSIEVPNRTLAVPENAATNFTLTAASTCGSPVAFEIFSPPELGALELTGQAAARYNVGFAQSIDQASIRACDAAGAGCSAPASIVFAISPGTDFQGREDSLAPYRQHISAAERDYLVRKLGNNRYDLIAGAGAALPLAELIKQKFLNQAIASPDLKETLGAIQDRGLLYGRPIETEEFIPGWRGDFADTAACPPAAERGPAAPGACFQPIIRESLNLDDPDDFAHAVKRLMYTTDRSWHADNFRYHWGYHLTTSRYLKRARYLAPLEAKLWQFWSGHFGTNTQIINGFQENLVGYYIETIEREIFGNFRSMMLGVPGVADRNGCAPLTPWKRDHGSILCDAASNLWLSNDKNTGANQDFARELLELYLLSPLDEASNVRNYSDIDDIVSMARFVSGIQVAEAKQASPLMAPVFAASFNPARHDGAPASIFTDLASLSPSLPAAAVSFEPGDVVRRLLDYHPGAARFIAAKLFAALVYPDPSPALAAELGAELQRLNYDLGAFLEVILTSEAMFSPRAAGRNCVSSPLETYSRILNAVEFPLIPLANSPDAETIYQSVVDGNLSRSGETILGYPTVFGYDYCGRAPGVDGSTAWLFSHLLVFRITNFIQFLNQFTASIGGQYDLSDIIDLVRAEPETAAGSPEDILHFFARRFDLVLTDAERSILLEYLTHHRLPDGRLTPLTWDPDDQALMREKLAGLMTIMAGFDQAATH